MRAIGLGRGVIVWVIVWTSASGCFLANPLDLSGSTPQTNVDLAQHHDLGGDGAPIKIDAGSPCTQLPTWPSFDTTVTSYPIQGADPYDFVVEGDSIQTNGVGTDDLSTELWHQPSTRKAPYVATIDTSTTYQDCDVCVLLYENYDPLTLTAASYFLARSGTVHVNTAVFDAAGGSMDVEGSQIHLVEWDLTNDTRVVNGRCYDVGSFAMTGSYGPVGVDFATPIDFGLDF
jgi:hypothetical protein